MAAQHNVAIIYDTGGRGVPRDEVEAMRWYHRAAEQGNASAQNNLAVMYSAGRGTLQDVAEAARWWRSAAEQGHPGAQVNLGWSLATGRGVPQNFVEAYMWLNLAAARLPPGQARELAVRERDAVGGHMTPTQIAEARRRRRIQRRGDPCSLRAHTFVDRPTRLR